jgi:hypothetical protein
VSLDHADGGDNNEEQWQRGYLEAKKILWNTVADLSSRSGPTAPEHYTGRTRPRFFYADCFLSVQQQELIFFEHPDRVDKARRRTTRMVMMLMLDDSSSDSNTGHNLLE